MVGNACAGSSPAFVTKVKSADWLVIINQLIRFFKIFFPPVPTFERESLQSFLPPLLYPAPGLQRAEDWCFLFTKVPLKTNENRKPGPERFAL